MNKYLIRILLIYCQLCSLTMCGWTKFEIHRPAIVECKNDIISFNDDIFCENYVLKNGTFINENEHEINCITKNDNNIFFEIDKKIYMMNKDYSVQYIFDIDKNYISISASNKYLYCFLESVKNKEIHVIDLDSKEMTIINVNENNIYYNCNDIILIHGINKIYVINKTFDHVYNCEMLNSKTIFYKNKVINFIMDYYNKCNYIENGNFKYKLNKYDFFSNVIKCYDNEIYFALIDYVYPENCCDLDIHCICKLNGTYLYKYNIETNDINIIHELKKEEVMIDFSNEYIVYYSNGNIYKNNQIIKKIDVIKVGEIIETIGDRNYSKGMEISTNLFAYYNNKIYYLNELTEQKRNS